MGWRGIGIRLVATLAVATAALIFAPVDAAPGMAIGLALTLLLGFAVGWLLNAAHGDIGDLPSELQEPDRWSEATYLHERSGTYIGFFERLLFFGAFWYDEPLVVGGWLAFKVASKWEVWSNVVRVPRDQPEGTNELSGLHARHAWGSRLFGRFLLGTLVNLVIAGVGVLVGRSELLSGITVGSLAGWMIGPGGGALPTALSEQTVALGGLLGFLAEHLGQMLRGIGLSWDILGAVYLGLGFLEHPDQVASRLWPADLPDRPRDLPERQEWKPIHTQVLYEAAAMGADARVGVALLLSGFALQLIGSFFPSGEAAPVVLIAPITAGILALTVLVTRRLVQLKFWALVDATVLGVRYTHSVNLHELIDRKRGRTGRWRESRVLPLARRVLWDKSARRRYERETE